MNCNSMEDQIIGYLLDTLSKEQRGKVENHLSSCENCQKTLGNFKRARSVWKRWVPVMPSYDFDQIQQKILTNVRAQKLIEEKSSEATVFVTIISELIKTQVKKLKTSGHNLIQSIISNTKISIPATIVVVIMVGLLAVNLFTKVSTTSVAWGSLVERIERIDFYKYQRRTIIKTAVHGELVIEQADVYRSSNYGIRKDQYFPMMDLKLIEYVFLSNNTTLGILQKIGRYTRSFITKEQAERMKELNEIGTYIKMLISSDYTKLGNKVLDGKKVEGIEVINPKRMKEWFESCVVRIWVDVETNLPIVHECEALINDGETELKIIFDNFAWNEEDGASMFEPNLSNYELMAEVKVGPMDEKTAVLSLRKFSEINDGNYPTSLALPNVMMELNQIHTKRLGEIFFWKQEDFDWEEYAFLRAHLETTTMFYGELVFQDKDVAYHGEVVTSDDSNLPLLRWKISDNEYRVIFGDLRIDDVRKEELIVLEELLSN